MLTAHRRRAGGIRRAARSRGEALAVLLMAVSTLLRAAPADAWREDDVPTPSAGALAPGRPGYVEFTGVPSSVARSIRVTGRRSDVSISARDCCIRDDILEIWVDACLVATVDSRGGARGTHPGETHRVVVEPGSHAIEYRLVGSTISPSGWYFSEALSSPARAEPCRRAKGRVTRVAALDVKPETPMWELPLRVEFAGVTCPSYLRLEINERRAASPVICRAGETPPLGITLDWPVFKVNWPGRDLAPGEDASVVASVTGSTEPEYRGSLQAPGAPVWVGMGDSYTSGHHQDADPGPLCPIQGPPCVTREDPRYSYVTRAADELNRVLSVPNAWRIKPHVVARSGAWATELALPGGQVDQAIAKLEPVRDSWNVVSLTGGANDAGFVEALGGYYGRKPFGKPWEEQNPSDCPDSDAVYRRAEQVSGAAREALQAVVTRASGVSRGVRIIDILYGHIHASSSPCYPNRYVLQEGELTFQHGSAEAVRRINGIHAGVNGPNIHRVDLTRSGGFGDDPLPFLQLTRYYGYPHPDVGGHRRIASLTVRALLPGGANAWSTGSPTFGY